MDKIPFCELDAAVLTRLSYLPLDVIVSADLTEKITLLEATERALAAKKPSDYIWKGDDRLLRILSKDSRNKE